jgi:hypothetical protein
MPKKCDYCCKSLRRCLRVDFQDRTMHFSCIEKIKKIRWEEDYNRLKNFLLSKGVLLLR